jgi:hypothetical protein
MDKKDPPLTDRTETDTTASEAVNLDINDTRGRAIGILIKRALFTYTAKEGGARFGYSHAAGTFYGACVTVARNGRAFGATQLAKDFATADEREAYIAKRIADASKRYASRLTSNRT